MSSCINSIPQWKSPVPWWVPTPRSLGVQNGVTAADRLSTRFGAERVVGVAAPATALAIGEWPSGTSARTTALVQTLKDAGVNVVAHDHVMEAIWEKFIVVCGGAVCALARQSVGALAQVPALRQLATMAEMEAQAQGLSIGPDALAKADQYVERIVATNPAWRPSLLQDLDAGRPLELDAWSGGAVKIGQELGIPTPANFAIYAGLKPYEHGRT